MSKWTFSNPRARCRNFWYIVTELATTATVKKNHHFGSQVGRKRRNKYLQRLLLCSVWLFKSQSKRRKNYFLQISEQQCIPETKVDKCM